MRINVKNFNEWSKPRSFFETGKDEKRSLIECALASVDPNFYFEISEASIDFDQIDAMILESVLRNDDEKLNEVFEFTKKAIKDSITNAGKYVSKGIQIGKDFFTTVKEISKKISEVVKKVIEKVKQFLQMAWDYSKKKGVEFISKSKKFIRKDLSGTLISSLSTVLTSKSAENEMKEAPKDVKVAVAKISGKSYDANETEIEKKMADSTEKIEGKGEEKITDEVLSSLAEVSESEISQIFTSMKGLLSKGMNIEDLHSILVEENESLLEKHVEKKGMFGWLIEAIGFALAPFAKINEFLIKAGTNGIMISVSTIARGSVNKAYKYVVMGTLCSLVYHIVHGIENIESHFSAHEDEAIKGKIALKKTLINLQDTDNMMIASIGGIFMKGVSAFYPIVGLVMEMVLVSIAAFETSIAFCELAEEKIPACEYIMKVEHSLEGILK